MLKSCVVYDKSRPCGRLLLFCFAVPLRASPKRRLTVICMEIAFDVCYNQDNSINSMKGIKPRYGKRVSA